MAAGAKTLFADRRALIPECKTISISIAFGNPTVNIVLASNALRAGTFAARQGHRHRTERRRTGSMPQQTSCERV